MLKLREEYKLFSVSFEKLLILAEQSQAGFFSFLGRKKNVVKADHSGLCLSPTECFYSVF